MLGLSIPLGFCARYTRYLLLLSGIILPLAVQSHSRSPLPFHYEYQWVQRYFDSVNETTDYREMIDFIVSLKTRLISQGYEIPPITELIDFWRDGLQERGIFIDPGDLEILSQEFTSREGILVASYLAEGAATRADFSVIPVKKHKDKKEIKMSPKMICGFLKFIAGGLCCIIPIPIVQGAGAALAVNGINDMINAVREEEDKHTLERKIAENPYLEAHLNARRK